jgi:hypothetical protein
MSEQPEREPLSLEPAVEPLLVKVEEAAPLGATRHCPAHPGHRATRVGCPTHRPDLSPLTTTGPKQTMA